MRIKEIAPLFYTIVIDTFGFGLIIPVFTALFMGDTSTFFAPSVTHAHKLLFLGICFTLYPLGMFFGATFLGDLSDIAGRKRVLLLAITGLTISYLCTALGTTFDSLALIMVSRLFGGLMAGSHPVSLASLVDLSTEDNKPVMMSTVALANSIGFVLGTLIGGIFSDKKLSAFFHFSTPSYLSALLALIALIWVAASYEDTFVPIPNKKIHPLRCFSAIFEASKHRAIRYLAFCFFLMQLGLSCFIQLVLLYMQKTYNYSSFMLGIYNGVLGVGFTLSVLVLLRIFVKFVPIRYLVAYALFLTGLIEISVGLFRTEIATWVLGFCLTLINNIAYSGFFTNMSDAVHEDRQGWAMGIGSATMALTFAVAGFELNLVPYLGIPTIIVIGGGLYLLSGLLMLYYAKQIYPHRFQA